MSETKYLKCPCQKCGGSIEFPTRGIGSAVNCPHCGEKTTLFAPPIEEASVGEPAPDGSTAAAATESGNSTHAPVAPLEASEPPAVEEARGTGALRQGKLVWLSLVVLAAAGLAAAGFVYKGSRSRRTAFPEERTKLSPKTSSAQVATNLTAVPSNATPPAKTPKSLDDLKVGAIALEKSKGSSLVYAVGVLRNESEHQRFGVTIELALSDARGNKAGTAKDYRAVIEPHQEWRFRALVLDSKAVSAQVERIREQE
jgi:hypothetical protein